MNGVKNKFLHDDVMNMFKQYDIIVISETHFSERIKCPANFIHVAHSSKIVSKKPRGGVAVYKNIKFEKKLEIITCNLRDCVVVQTGDVTIAAMYIPPSNSEYYDEIYTKNLELIYNEFSTKHLTAKRKVACLIEVDQ